MSNVDRANVNPFVTRWLMPLVVLLVIGCSEPKQEFGSATEHFLAAQTALGQGDKTLALKEFDASIAAGPDVWTYFERGRLLAEMGEDGKALADCEAGLKLDAEHSGLKWLRSELKKPADRRFQGANGRPPVAK